MEVGTLQQKMGILNNANTGKE